MDEQLRQLAAQQTQEMLAQQQALEKLRSLRRLEAQTSAQVKHLEGEIAQRRDSALMLEGAIQCLSELAKSKKGDVQGSNEAQQES